VSERGFSVLICLATALTAGFVIGAEREQEAQASFGGVRTFPLFALAGALGTLVHPWLLAALAVAVGGLLAVTYLRETPPEAVDVEEGSGLGISTQLAALATFGLGALTTASELEMPMSDRLLLVGAGTTAVLGLLALKRKLHQFVARVSKQDVYATTKLLLLSVVLLPLLPNEDMGPWNALNPRNIGWLVVLISAIGFAGYVAVRLFGARKGLGLTGLLGGLASSTAVTLTFSGRARETPSLAPACAVAVVLAGSTMFPRVAIELAAVSPALAARAAWPLGLATAGGLGAGAFLYLRASRASRERARDDTTLELENPFALKSALQFAALFTAVLLFSAGARAWFAEAGVLVSALVTGLANVDAITLSVAGMHDEGTVSAHVATLAVGVAVGANTLSKVAIAWALGGGRLALRIALAMSVALAAGGAALAFIR
jgi:uncharacterized membrane protein (DUF4010 family)